MNWPYAPALLLPIVTALVAGALALYAWRRRSLPSAAPFALLMLAVAVWSVGNALELASTDLSSRLLWVNIEYLGIVLVPLAWLVFALHYAGQAAWLTRRRLLLLAVEPVLTVLLVWTNPAHGLYRHAAWLEEAGSFLVLRRNPGIAFWLHAGYSYAVLAVGTFLLISTLRRRPRDQRGPVAAIVLGVAVAWAGNILSNLPLGPLPGLDLTPFALTLTGLVFGWGLLRFRMLDVFRDLIPVARATAFASMSDGVIVLDARDQIIDLNPAAEQMLGRPAAAVVGQPPAHALDGWLGPVLTTPQAVETQVEIARATAAGPAVYEVRSSPLRRRDGALAGRLVLVRDITRRKRAEQALTAAEGRLVTVVTNAPIILMALDAAGRITLAEGAGLAALGQEPDALIGRPLAEVYAHQPELVASVHAALTGAETATLVNAGGATFDVRYTRLQDSAGQVSGLILVATDISARTRAEAAARESEERFRLLVERVQDYAIFMLDPAGRVTTWNAGAERITGYLAEEIIGQPVARLIAAEEQADEAPALLERAATTGHAQEDAWQVRRDGSRFWASIVMTALYSERGKVRGFAAIMRDWTERKHYEDQLRFLVEASAQLAASLDYETTLQRVAQLVVPTLADACVIDAVEEGATLQQVAVAHVDPAREARLRDLRQRYPLDPNASHGVPKVIRTGQPDLITVAAGEVETADADEYQGQLYRLGFRSHLVVPLVARGRIIGAISLLTDASGRQYRPADLPLAEDLAYRAALALDNARLYQESQAAIYARDQFLSIASHELRTPLTSVRGYTQLLLRHLMQGRLDPVQMNETLTSIYRGAERLTVLLTDILDVSRLRLGRFTMHPQPIEFVPLLSSVLRRYQDLLGDRFELVFTTSYTTCPVVADSSRLEQVLTNLIDNAVKYSPAGGTIRVTLVPDGQGVLLSVQDEGMGLPPGTADTIFEPFQRAGNVAQQQLPGLGLGLYICRMIVHQHGGQIWAESAGEGQGTTLHVWLPSERRDDQTGAAGEGNGLRLPAAGPPDERVPAGR